jgi:serine/threonine-protein kinase
MDGMLMVYVPGGEFEMGSLDGQPDEAPVHVVELDGFWVDSTEVTNGQYERCVAAGSCQPPAALNSRTREAYYGAEEYRDYPVIKVNWHDARQYCAWAGVRLPTEAEWEYAARWTDGRAFPWGDTEPDCDRANYWGSQGVCVGDTTPVGAYLTGRSWCGAYDMGGNVWEWLEDVYAEYSPERQLNPRGALSGRYRVMRGGSWTNDEASMRCANRDRDPAQTPYVDDRGFYSLGFRCARDVW